MKVSKIRIKNLFGIKEVTLEGKDYEIRGEKATGKTSIIEAIRFALRNKSDKDIILRKGTNEGEVLFETNTGISILRKEKFGKDGTDTVKEGKTPITKKESFLRELFSDLQLDPIGFVNMPKLEQNRIILDLIDFKWDIDWIKEQFGEIVPEIDYNQNILKVLSDVQAEKGYYFRTRQEINRESKNKQAFISEITDALPEKYKASDWVGKSLSELYTKIETIQEKNRQIEKAQIIVENEENKKRSFDSSKKIALSALNSEVNGERNRLEKEITSLETRIKEAKRDLSVLEEKKLFRVEKIELKYEADIAKFAGTIEENKAITKEKTQDTSTFSKEAAYIEKMKGHIGEYNRMCGYEIEVENLITIAKVLTEKIEKARTLPGEILAQSKLPLENLSIENGIPLIMGLPINNLSDGEKLELCVDVATLKKNVLNLLLIDGIEKLSPKNAKILYAKCKAKKVQFIATRTTSDDSLTIIELKDEKE
jgi:exonuclease SbcC